MQLLASGSNAHGQLANGTEDDSHVFAPCSFAGYPPAVLPPNSHVVQLAGGANHTILLLQRSTEQGGIMELWGTGDGSRGQLGFVGDGNSGISNTLVFRQLNVQEWIHRHGLDDAYSCKSVAAAWETTYLVVSRGTGHSDFVLSMGANDFGDLGIGIGGATNKKAKAKAKVHETVGLTHLIQLHNLLGVDIDRQWVEISSITTGPHHVVVTADVTSQNGEVRQSIIGWGAARHGQLGLTSSPLLNSPTLLTIDSLANSRVLTVATGSQHTVFLHECGQITAIGSNKKKQTEKVHSFGVATKIACTWNGTYAAMVGDGLPCIIATGAHSHGQLGRVIFDEDAPSNLVDLPIGTSLIDMVCGSEHVLCLLKGGETPAHVWGWGWNEHGNLGIGSTQDVPLSVQIWPDAASNATRRALQTWAGCGTSWIVVSDP